MPLRSSCDVPETSAGRLPCRRVCSDRRPCGRRTLSGALFHTRVWKVAPKQPRLSRCCPAERPAFPPCASSIPRFSVVLSGESSTELPFHRNVPRHRPGGSESRCSLQSVPHLAQVSDRHLFPLPRGRGPRRCCHSSHFLTASRIFGSFRFRLFGDLHLRDFHRHCDMSTKPPTVLHAVCSGAFES